MSRNELIRKADEYRKMAARATGGERVALLRKARNYYDDAEMDGMALWCERHMG